MVLRPPRFPSLFALLLAAVAVAACGNNGSSATPPADGGQDAAALVAARPYTMFVPNSYDKTRPTPLVIMMHGYGASGALEEAFMDLTDAAQTHGFLYAYGDGTVDPTSGSRFWNATDACCNFSNVPVDDVAYINAIREDVSQKYNVDPKRFFLVGHSNGGFMAHRYACDHAEQVAAIVSLAGAVWEDASRCEPSVPVAVAEVHGDMDSEIGYDGGVNRDRDGAPHEYPSAPQTVATWVTKDACTQPVADGGTLSLDSTLPQGNTLIARYGGCGQATTDVELWTIHGGSHIPGLTLTWGEAVWSFLSAHPKP